jgi:hypothetical protein
MYSALKIFNYQKSEKGFVLIAAIMAVMIMLAVSFFILTTSTQDIRISARLVGERKALSAAEAGAMAVYASAFDLPTMAANNSNTPILVDPINDPSTSYIVHTTLNTTIPPIQTPGYTGGYGSPVYSNIITGTDSNYGSSASIDIGLSPPPLPSDTTYGNMGAGGG